MCGIAAYLNFNQRDSISDFAGLLAEGIAHRGPDALHSYSDPDSRFLFVHALLKIMDRSKAAIQPIRDAEGNVMVFNGSVYNYKDLQKKYNLSSSLNDTQTLMKLLGTQGASIFYQIEGMFALIYYAADTGKFLVARDRYGEKPLFMARCPMGNIALASERKSLWNLGIDKKVNPMVAMDFLFYHKLDLSALYLNIQAIPPGHFAYIESSADADFIPIKYSTDDDGEDWDSLMHKSVRHAHVADFPVAHTLSGGIDSGGLLSYVVETQKPDVYSFTSPGFVHDEKEASSQVARSLGIEEVKWVTFPKSISALMADWKEISRIHEEPLASPSSMAQFYIYKQIARDMHRVVLEGQGSDEHFCGYTYYYLGLLTDNIPSLQYILTESTPAEKTMYKKWLMYKNLKPLYKKMYVRKGHHLAQAMGFSPDMWKEYASAIVDPKMKAAQYGGVRHQMEEDRLHGLFQYILRTADRSSMYNHLEVRLPYLNSGIISRALALEDEDYWYEGYYKKYLRDSLSARLPKNILEQKKKIGFEAPYGRVVESIVFKRELDTALDYFKKLGWLQPQSELKSSMLDPETYNLLAWKIVALYYAIV